MVDSRRPPAGTPPGPAQQPVLELRSIGVPGREHPALAEVSLRVEAGERVALLGASGAARAPCWRWRMDC